MQVVVLPRLSSASVRTRDRVLIHGEYTAGLEQGQAFIRSSVISLGCVPPRTTLDHTSTKACDSSPTNDDPRRRVGVALGPRVRAGGDAGRGALLRPGRPAVLRCQLLSAVVVFAAASPAHGAPLVQQPRCGWATAEGRAREGEERRRRRRAYVRARRQGECMRVWPWTSFFYGLECSSDR